MIKPIIDFPRLGLFTNLVAGCVYLSFSLLTVIDISASQELKNDKSVSIASTGDDKFTNYQGQSLISPRFDYADPLFDGLALVRQDGKLDYLKF